MKKKFKLEVVISSILGKLFCDIGEVYECLNFLTGQDLFTHQLPRAMRECQPEVFEQHPFLKEINLEDVTPDNVWSKLGEIKRAYPDKLELELEPVSTYKSMGAIDELEKTMKRGI